MCGREDMLIYALTNNLSNVNINHDKEYVLIENAIRYNNMKLLKYLYLKFGSVSKMITEIIDKEKLSLLKFLHYELNINLGINNNEAIKYACFHCQTPDIVKFLCSLECVDYLVDEHQPFLNACKYINSSIDVIKLFVKLSGPNFGNLTNNLMLANKNGRLDILKFLCPLLDIKEFGFKMFCDAIMCGHESIVDYLHSLNPSYAYSNNNYAIIISCKRKPSMIKCLMKFDGVHVDFNNIKNRFFVCLHYNNFISIKRVISNKLNFNFDWVDVIHYCIKHNNGTNLENIFNYIDGFLSLNDINRSEKDKLLITESFKKYTTRIGIISELYALIFRQLLSRTDLISDINYFICNLPYIVPNILSEYIVIVYNNVFTDKTWNYIKNRNNFHHLLKYRRIKWDTIFHYMNNVQSKITDCIIKIKIELLIRY